MIHKLTPTWRVIIILQGFQTFLLPAPNLYEEFLTSHKHLHTSLLLFSTPLVLIWCLPLCIYKQIVSSRHISVYCSERNTNDT